MTVAGDGFLYKQEDRKKHLWSLMKKIHKLAKHSQSLVHLPGGPQKQDVQEFDQQIAKMKESAEQYRRGGKPVTVSLWGSLCEVLKVARNMLQVHSMKLGRLCLFFYHRREDTARGARVCANRWHWHWDKVSKNRKDRGRILCCVKKRVKNLCKAAISHKFTTGGQSGRRSLQGAAGRVGRNV